MHVVSFYSFKGGVGRTMALANVGYELARLGRKVLLVDFDLEAPGLASYEPFASNAEVPGVVDYVAEYLETGEAPEAGKFIMHYGSDALGANLPLWLMPAGRRNDDYSTKLSSIDWTDLYETRSGYLLFEDLKQQWAGLPQKFDYILVDSRTGLTDVAGICTRQLPSTVCLMFAPNDQNIDGLDLVVSKIRSENEPDRHLRLLFCPSNVPLLDDEFEILKGKLDRAKAKLDFDEPAATIHRYESLALIDQAIFVRDRPTTRLADELRGLTKTVMRGNLRDREGALAEISVLRRQLRGSRSNLPRPNAEGASFLTSVTDQIAEIIKHHSSDGEIGWNLASIYHLLGDLSAETAALSTAVKEGYRSNEARLRRGLALLALGQSKTALQDLREVVLSPETSSVDLWAALEALQETGMEWIETLKESRALERLAPDDRLKVSHLLKSEKMGLPLAAKIAEDIRNNSTVERLRRSAQTELSLSLIGLGEFERAMEVLGPTRDDVLASKSVTRSFNYAMAEWGHTGRPEEDMLRHTLDLAYDWPGEDANFEQCIALCHALNGEGVVALDHIRRARRLVGHGSVFSCWRYLRVSGPEIQADLDALAGMVEGSGQRPAFLKPGTLH